MTTIKPGLNYFFNNAAVGVEAANGFVKGLSTTSEADKVDTYINTLTESTEGEYKRFKAGLQTEPVYKIDDEYFKVDKEIDETLGVQQWSFAQKNEVKYEEPYWQKSFIIAVYRQVAGKDGIECFVTTGLPSVDDRRASVKKMLRETFEGKTFEVNEERFTIKELHFLGQASATFFNDLVIINEDGKEQPNMRFLAQTSPKGRKGDARLMYVDIGWGTTDKKLVIGTTIQDDKGTGSDGLKFIWEKVIKKAIKDDTNNEWLLDYDVLSLEDQLRRVPEGETVISRDYQEVDILKYYDEVMSEEANSIIKSLYVGDYDKMVYEQVRFTGGGSIPMRKYLEEAIEKYHKGNEGRIAAYKFLEQPQATNCKGYLKQSQIKMRAYQENKKKK